MTQFGRKSNIRRRGSERRRRIAIVAVMAVLAGSLLMLGREVLTGARRPAETQTLANTPKEPQDAEIYTGSILFMPHDGKTCHQYLFDNVSGRLNDNGMVDCERAAYHPVVGPPKKWSAARVHVISSGFRER
jgi:hypothetical protein